jgi:hypothetical protein
MTEQPDPQVHPFDLSNADGLRMGLPVSTIVFAVREIPNTLAVTIRNGGTTLSFLLSKEQAMALAESLRTGAGRLSGLIVPNGVPPEMTRP